MRTAGCERVISCLCVVPRMCAKAYLSVLPTIIKERAEQEILRVYLTDAAKLIAENTERFAGGGHLKERYLDIIRPPVEETRSEEEIISRVLLALGGVRSESI